MKLNNTLSNNEWVEEIKKKIKKYVQTNKNRNTIYKNLWDTTKAILRGNFIAINADIKRKVRSQINTLTLKLRELENEDQRQGRKK